LSSKDSKTPSITNTPSTPHPYGPQSQSVNFVQHKRFDDALINPDHMIKPRMPKTNMAALEAQMQQPTVGDAPKHKLLQSTTLNTKPETSAPKRHHHAGNGSSGSAGGRHNARRKYYVSTNQDEPESSRLSTSGKRGHAQTNDNDTARTSKTISGASGSGVVERASDDYCLERFKKNMRFSRNSKIKIA
jgi:hypothetical protein